MSKEYIDKDDFYDVIDGGFDLNFDELPEPKAALLEMIRDFDPADVKPVVRGEWETVSESAWDGNEYKCSACGWKCCDDEFGDDPTEDYRFCPNCGADMRKEVKK